MTQQATTQQTVQLRTESTQGTPPIAKFHLGPIRVSVWVNTDPNGVEYHSIRVERRYNDKATGGFKSTNAFRPNELPVVADLVTRAYMHIEELNASN